MSKNTAATDDAIAKLTSANEALRNQLRVVTRALEAHTERANAPARDDDEDDEPLGGTNNMKQKNQQLKNAQKKLKQYKRENIELQRKLHAISSADKVATLESATLEKQQRIASLIEENRSLVNVQRTMSKQMKSHEEMKDQWPERLAKAQDHVRVLKEKMRKLKQKDEEHEDKIMKQHQHIVDLQSKRKKLEEKLAAIGGKSEPLPASEKEQLEEKYRAENSQLKSKISLLERSQKQQQLRTERELKLAKEQVAKEQGYLQEADKLLQKKDKQVRLQVLQLRKLKRNLRELEQQTKAGVEGVIPVPVPVPPVVDSRRKPSKNNHRTTVNPAIAVATAPKQQQQQQEEEAPEVEAMEVAAEVEIEAEAGVEYLAGNPATVIDEVVVDEDLPVMEPALVSATAR